MKRLALIDGDIVAYKAACVAQQDDGFPSPSGKKALTLDKQKAASELNGIINDLADLVNADEVLVCLSDASANWRKQEVDPKYKAHRDPEKKPKLLPYVRDLIQEEWPFKHVPRLEADDVMGICATAPGFRPGVQKVIVSEDKDMAGVPGWLFNPAKDNKPRRITQHEADRFHLWQTIVGDASDGYPGAPGVGPKSIFARQVLDPLNANPWKSVLDAYRKSYGGGPDAPLHALANARLARILRHGDYDYRTHEVRLWNPPG